METLRIGFLGAGYMSGRHAKCLAQMEGVELAAVCGSTSEGGRVFAEERGGNMVAFPSGEEMLSQGELDVLYICTPPFARDGLVERAAERGIHLFVEKPLALDFAVAKRMTEAAERNGVTTQVGFQFRFHESVRVLKRLLTDGAVGRPTLFSARYWTRMDGKPWWRDRSKSGGQIFEQLVHLYDLALHFLGEADLGAVRGYMANLCRSGQADYSIEDTSVGLVPMRNGGVGVLTGSNNAVDGHFIADFRVVCERALLDYQSTGQPWVQPDRATLVVDGKVREEWIETGNAQMELNRDFIEAARERRPASVPLRDGLRAQEVVEAVIRNSGF